MCIEPWGLADFGIAVGIGIAIFLAWYAWREDARRMQEREDTLRERIIDLSQMLHQQYPKTYHQREFRPKSTLELVDEMIDDLKPGGGTP